MLCPKCGYGQLASKAIEKEPDSDTKERTCGRCGYKFLTVELDVDMFEKLTKKEWYREKIPQ